MSAEGRPETPAYDDLGRDPGAPVLTRLAAGGVSGLLRLIYLTVEGISLQPEFHARVLSSLDESHIGVFWHRHIGIAPYFFPTLPWVCLASRSRDGELLARIMAKLGGKSVRGSSGRMDGRNKGGSSALRQLARAAEGGWHPIFTPDGPVGPPDKVKPGVIFMGAMTGRPIVPLGFAATRSFRLPTWDGTIVPLPFAKLVVSYGEAMEIPPGIDDAGLEAHKAELESRLAAVNEEALASIPSIRPSGRSGRAGGAS